MPVQLTLRSPKGGRVLYQREYADGYRIDAVSGWLVVVDRNGSTVAAHAACPGLEGAIVEHAVALAGPAPGLDQGGYGDSYDETDQLRAEVERLTRLLDDASREAERADTAVAELVAATQRAERAERERDEAREDADRYARALTTLEQERDEARRMVAAEQTRLGEQAARLIDERNAEGRARIDAERLLASYRRQLGELEENARAPLPERPLPGLAPDPTLGERPGDPGPLEEDPRRPHGDSWPDDAVTLRYRELRHLLALHLDRYGAGRDVVRAMREGDVSLRLVEVLDR